jgi:class 3 adenylate cyclase
MDIHALPRRGYSSLTVHRDRGVLWVCDISNSSSFINSDDLAEHIEAFLPRLHWVSSLAIQAIHGELIQWTGDGFIAWFPLEVERQLGRTCNRILEAIWHFTAFINITQLCVNSPRPFRIRHGLTYEPDALVTLTTYQDGHVSKIISGRNVVLAFRISGVEADFPNVATQQKIVQALSSRTKNLMNLKRWTLTEAQLLKYFKGEKMGTTSLYVSGRPKVSQSRADTWITRAESLLARAESGRRRTPVESTFVENFFPDLVQSKGQDWCEESLDIYVRFLKENMLGSLQKALDVINQLQPDGRGASADGPRRRDPPGVHVRTHTPNDDGHREAPPA